MYARVATFASSDPGSARQGFAEIERRASSGPPPGVPGRRTSVETFEVAVKIDL